MEFWKMNGAGNDFIIINNIKEQLSAEQLSECARILCKRHMSIGADGFMAVDKPSAGVKADYRMRFYNADGMAGEMCGNGARCICRYGYENGFAGEEPVVETMAGIITGKRINKQLYRIRLNDPSVVELNREYRLDDQYNIWNGAGDFAIKGSYFELGDPGIPHLVVEYQGNVSRICGAEHLMDANENVLRELGRALRWNSALPKGANVNFVEVIGNDEVCERTFERGVEEFTYACGTGTGCAAAVLAYFGKVSGNNVKFNVPGGNLYIDIEEINDVKDSDLCVHGIFLTGPTNVVIKGEITDENLPLL